MFFRKFDLLHIPISLSYNNEYFYSTNIGATLSILCFIMIICLGSYEIKTLHDKSSFSIISNQYTDLSEIIDFSKSPLLFQLIDNTGEIMEINDKLYEFIAYDMEWIAENDKNGKKNYKVINTKLEMDYCDRVYNDSNSEYLSTFNLSNYFCIKSSQNITSYGYLGDMNNGYKGFRIYLNKCNGNKNCYNDSYILQKLKNIKFRVTYLGLNINIFNLDEKNINYQMFSKSCSISTNILKKFYFTFSIGRFNLFDNIFYKKKIVLNYIIGNNPIMDLDLDPTSTIDSNRYTLAYFSFNFDGNILEVNKEVKRFFDTVSIIGNAFNILLTLFKIINNYYSNKILFVDIFKNIFLSKDKKNINFIKYRSLNYPKHFNKNNNFQKKNIMDLSDEIGINNNINNVNNNNIYLKKVSNKVVVTSDKNNIKRKFSQIYTINKEEITPNKIILFYLFPIWVLKKHKSFNNVCLIKDKICTYFSVERLNELIKFKECLDIKAKKLKVSNTELIKVNKKFQDSNDSNEIPVNKKS